MNGKDRRLARVSINGRYLLVPLDHGMTLGAIPGIENVPQILSLLDAGGATGFIGHKGVLKAADDPLRCGSFLHISANTKYSLTPYYKSQVGTVQEALRFGADGVSVHINLGGSSREADMIEDLGKISRECDEWQVPLLVMVYPRGKKVADPPSPEDFATVVRMVAELGADLIKTGYTGSIESFHQVVIGSPVPVLIAGGPKVHNDQELLLMIHDAMQAGASGISLGRNIFQHAHPKLITRAIHKLVIDGYSVEEALRELNHK